MTGKPNHANGREHLFRSLFLATATLATVASAPMMAVAQESAEQEEKKVVAEQASESTTLEEVEVTGFRKSLADAISAKRDSDNITDVISAEDVGKSTDANIAEALQRVTGISIARENGEGTTVTVRGVSADLNNISMNGVALTATGGDLNNDGGSNAVNLSQFSSDILAKIEVVKTPSANHDEGSLGAAINLSSFKPLNVSRDRRLVEVQGRYAPFADSSFDGGDSRVNVALSEKLLDDKLGLSLVASTESQSGRTDAYQIPRYTVHRAGGELVGNNGVTLPGGYINAETGEHMTEFDYGDGPSDLYAHVPFEMFYAYDTFNRDRDTVNGAIQFRPTEQTDVLLNLTYSKLQSENESQRFNIRPQNGSPEGDYNVFDPDTYTLVGYRRTANAIFGPGTGPWRNPGYVRPQANIEDFTEENKVVSFDIEHVMGDFTFNLSGGHSETTAVDDRVIQSTFQIENQPDFPNNPRENSFNGMTNPGFYSGYECPNGISSACNIIVSADNVLNRDPSLGPVSDAATDYSFGSFNFRDREIEDTSSSVFFDVQWDRQFGPVTMIESGLKWSDRTKDQRQTNTNYNRFGVMSLFGAQLSDFSSGSTPSDFGSELGIGRDTLSDGWAAFDPFLALNAAELSDPDNVPRVLPDLVNSRVLNNEVFGGYIKANFEFMDGQLSGDIGARYVHTNVDVSGGASVQLLTADFSEAEANLEYYGSQEAAQDALGPDLQGPNLPNNGGANPDYRELEAVPTSDQHSYDNLLPSLNLNYALNDDMILRFAASKTMARPPIDQLNPRFRYAENAFNAQSFASAGNPKLEPFESFNLDLSYEWYFADESLMSVALFNKDLSNFTRRVSELYFIRDLRETLYDENGVALNPDDFGSRTGEDNFALSFDDLLPFDENNQPENCMPNREFDMGSPVGQIPYGCDVVAFNTFVNGDGGYVRGVELGFQHNFTTLPGIWSNFGVMANYTYSDSETTEETEVGEDGTVSVTQLATPFPETSLHTYNATVFYEDEDYLVRLAYNKRTDYLLNANVLGGYAHYREGFDTLDLSAAWNITSKLQVNFQGVNLLDTVTRDYAVYTGLNGDENLPGESVDLGDAPSARTIRLANTGPIYRLGLRYNF
ncbi:TonB-dependent receptor [Microbulbifer mangrovi]|uniref:TonB-dependent receptor n=1 Tax=Microbulbifer mangrovi TaxID=927787 RepID=UPI0009909150|nr:TonB-dependent receptor [Microbulbifer mangrovi]